MRLITAPRLPAVVADRGQIGQMLLNLAVNAREAMPQGGIVTFATSVADPGEAHAGVWPGARPGRCAKLTVSDTGRGMDAETMSRAFEPFFTTKPPGQGTGLGLSAVYGIVTKAGGAITIDSEEGRGTSFRIYLPAAHDPAEIPAPGKSPGAGQSILVVDDQPAVVEIASRILHHNGYHTLQAGSYDEATSLLSTYDPDLLLTDRVLATLPEQGLAARARKLRPGIRVLYMSGSPACAPEPGGGQIRVIRKPFTAKDLLEKVHERHWPAPRNADGSDARPTASDGLGSPSRLPRQFFLADIPDYPGVCASGRNPARGTPESSNSPKLSNSHRSHPVFNLCQTARRGSAHAVTCAGSTVLQCISGASAQSR